VQKLAWILVTAYTGPVGLFFYLLACRNPGPGLHGRFTEPHWKQALNSEMHCLAGDATGIILAAFVVSYFHLPNGIDLILEYLSAFVVGLLVFQALMMRSMYDNDYGKAVRKTFFAETVSMNMVMVGMIPTMVVLMHHLAYGDDPLHPLFWFIRGMATIAGGITAYGINSWLVRNKLKHGCMTLPERGAGVAVGGRGPAPDGHGARPKAPGQRACRSRDARDGHDLDRQGAGCDHHHLCVPPARRLADLDLPGPDLVRLNRRCRIAERLMIGPRTPMLCL
jgi:hypothetical protein